MDIFTCTKCRKTFWEDEMASFNKRRNTYYYCKVCAAEIQRNWRKDNVDYRGYIRKYTADYRRSHPNLDAARQKDPEKVKAQNKAYYATRNSRQPCGVCGDPNSQAHHDDYSKPLEVRWLCPLHHKEVHLAKALCRC